MCSAGKALAASALFFSLITSCTAAVPHDWVRQPRTTAYSAPGLEIIGGGRRPNAALHLELDDIDSTTIITTTTTAVPTSSKSKVCFPASKCVDYLVCGVRFGSCYQNHCDGVVPTFSTPVCASSTMIRAIWVSTTTTRTSSAEPTSTDILHPESPDYSQPTPTDTPALASTDTLAALPTDPQAPAVTDAPTV